VAINVLDKIRVCVDGALPLLSAICDRIGLANRIDDHIDDDQKSRIVSTGTAIKALVMNIVANRKALYKLSEFYSQADTEKLFGQGIHPCNLTDDVMARALDDLYGIGAKKAMTETAMAIINEYDIPVTSVHSDTTSKSVYGAYENSSEEDDTIHITKGHSKDHRPDLNQIVFGLGTTKDRIIVIGDVRDGNTNDKTWNKDILKELREAMGKYGLPDFIYVADSAAVTEETLERLYGNGEDEPTITFVSRLPGNFNLEEELKAKAMANPKNWENIGSFTDKKGAAQYKVQSFKAELYGRTYRFIVCHSSQLQSKKEKTIQSHIKREETSLLKAIEEFEKVDFYCTKDAEEALRKFEEDSNLKYHELVYKVESIERKVKRKKRGRPKKDEVPQFETIYKGKINLYKDDLRIQQYKGRESLFVLITNSMDEEKMDNKTILKEYKEQSSVETTFKVLKDPYFIDELFLKTPQRVEALSYVMLIALMVLTLLERTVRENLKTEKERVTVSGNRKTYTPTGVSIIEALEQIQILFFYDGEKGVWQRHCRLDDNQKRLIHLAGFSEDIYTEGFRKNA